MGIYKVYRITCPLKIGKLTTPNCEIIFNYIWDFWVHKTSTPSQCTFKDISGKGHKTVIKEGSVQTILKLLYILGKKSLIKLKKKSLSWAFFQEYNCLFYMNILVYRYKNTSTVPVLVCLNENHFVFKNLQCCEWSNWTIPHHKFKNNFVNECTLSVKKTFSPTFCSF